MSTCSDPSLSRYKGAGCRCDECRALNIAYMRDYHRARIITGRKLVSAGRARDHLLWLRSNGLSYRRAAELAGLSLSAMHTYRIATGRTQSLHPETERALLAIRP